MSSVRAGHTGTLCAIPAILVALAALLPALDKAFTVDDLTFLLQARHLLADPVHPTAFEMVFHGTRIRLSQELVTGPVMAYLLLPSMLIGAPEWAAHVIQIVCLLAAAVGSATLALRLGGDRRQARAAALLLVTSPAVLGMAATAMPDVPAMGFAVIGVERLLAWKQNRSLAAGLASAILLALAALSRPHALMVLAVGAIWLLSERLTGSCPRPVARTLTSGLVTPLVLALLTIAGIVLLTRDPVSGRTIAGATTGRMDLGSVVFNLAGFTLDWATVFPLALLWPVLRKGRCRSPLVCWIAFDLGMLLGVAAWYFGGEAWRSVPVLLLTGLSAAVLSDILLDSWRNQDRTQLGLGLWLLAALPAASYVHLPPKLLVVSAPAMAILLALQLPPASSGRPVSVLVPLSAAGGLALGILVIRADTVLAEVGRVGGTIVSQEGTSGRKIWVDGAWGFQWYAMAAGAEPMADTGPGPGTGDILVTGLHARGFAVHYPFKTLLLQRVFADPGGRVDGQGAGFFTNRAGPWPWTWGREEIGRIEVWRIDSGRRRLR